MSNNKTQTVRDFLTPTKLFTSTSKLPPKNKGAPNAKISALKEGNTSLLQSRSGKSRQKDNHQFSSFIFEPKSNKRQQGLHNQSRIQINDVSHSHIDEINQYSQNKYSAEANGPIYLKYSRASSRGQQFSGSPPGPNQQLNRLHTRELISRLHTIKKTLEQQILNLQNLLDETSTNLDNIDKQYEQIKQTIMKYTSNYLDSAYREYKKNMNWIKYEQFQKQGLNLLTQINLAITQREAEIREEKRVDPLVMHSSNRKLESKIQQYNSAIHDLSLIRKECMQMRPTITEFALKKFEQGLFEISKF